MAFFDGFADSFFFFIAFIVVALSLVDWLSGEAHRAKLREKCGLIWLHLGEAKYSALVLEDLKWSYRTLCWIFGPRLFSLRRLLSFSVFVGVAFLAAIYRFWLILPISGEEMYKPLFQEERMFHYVVEFSRVHLLFNQAYPFFLVPLFISLAITIAILRLLSVGNPKLGVTFWVLMDNIANLVVMFVVLQFLVIFLLGGMFADPGAKLERELAVFTPFLLAILPTVFYLFSIALTISVKLLRNVLFPVAMLFLLRLHESKKGVIANIAIGVGVLAKLLQQAIKVAS